MVVDLILNGFIIPLSTQVKHLYGDGHIPEIAAKPGDDTLYVNIWDKVRDYNHRKYGALWARTTKNTD